MARLKKFVLLSLLHDLKLRVNVFTFEILFDSKNSNFMARPRLKTETTTLKMTPEVRHLWEQCAAKEYRSLTSMFEVMVREYAKKQEINGAFPLEAPKPMSKGRAND